MHTSLWGNLVALYLFGEIGGKGVYWGYVWSGSLLFFVNSAEAVVFDNWVPRTSEDRVCVVRDVMST